MKANRKDLIAHYSQTKSCNTIQDVGERVMVLYNAECFLHPGKWKKIEPFITFAVEQVFGEKNELVEALEKYATHLPSCNLDPCTCGLDDIYAKFGEEVD